MDWNKWSAEVIDFVEERKKLIKRDKEEDEKLSEFELCREYSKTRSMEQD